MTWNHREPGKTPEGEPMCKALIELKNDRGEFLGSVMWFYDDGPFYAHAVDLNEPNIVRRIGPCTTLESGKKAVEKAVEGGIPDLNHRAGYPRS